MQDVRDGVMRLEFERMDILLHPLVTSDKRLAHGLELFIYGNGHFVAGNKAIHALRLPCNASHFTLERKALEFALRQSGQHMWPTAALSFVLMARHCKSDRGDEVCHNCGYGSVTVQDLVASEGRPVSVRLVDRPGEFELLYATDNPQQAENQALVSCARDVRKHDGHEFYERGTVVFTGARVHLPLGVHTRWADTRVRGGAETGARRHELMDDPASWDFMSTRTQSHADAVRARIQHVLEAHKDRTYEPYGGKGVFQGWRAMNQMWRGYFVPTYRLTCGVDMPSGLVMMGTEFDRVPKERLYSQLFRAHMDCHNIDQQQFVQACKNILSIHWHWATQCRQEQPTDTPDFLAPEARELTWLELLVLCVLARSLSSLPNALCYTTDFAELRDAARKTVKEIVTEQPEMAPMLTRALDCEDGAMWIYRLWLALVQNTHLWEDPVVYWASRVLYLYLVRIDVMHCGECHIMSKLELRESAYRRMMRGVRMLQDKGQMDDAELERVRRSVYSTCFWPNAMHNGERPMYVPCLDEVQHDSEFDRYPLPSLLYVEPTRASHPNQAPYDVNTVQGDARGLAARQHARQTSECTQALCALGTQELRHWEALLTNASDMNRAEFMQRPLEHSPFYKASLVGHYPCVALHLARRDLAASRGQDQIRTPMLDHYLETHSAFADVVHHDRKHDATFGVYSAHELCNARSLCAVPYAYMDRETILCTAMTLDCEPPVLPSDPPASTDGLPVELMGRSEPLPQLAEHDHLLRAYARKDDQDDMPYVQVRFLPHDRVIHGGRLAAHLQQCDPQMIQGGLHCRRYPLAQASIHQAYPWSAEELAHVRQILEPLGLWDADPVLFLTLLDKGRLQELARERAPSLRASPAAYDNARHWIGERVRTRPVYMKVVDVHCDIV